MLDAEDGSSWSSIYMFFLRLPGFGARQIAAAVRVGVLSQNAIFRAVTWPDSIAVSSFRC